MGRIIITICIYLFLIIGEIRCIVKAIQCDWNAPYKAEVIYTAGAFTGFGCIIGWINIDD